MIDDRNCLSHIYSEDEFNKIIKNFSRYVTVFKKVEQVIKNLLSAKGNQEIL